MIIDISVINNPRVRTFYALRWSQHLILVEVPWGGKMNVVDVLFFLRDHDILHIGWNLALMDALNMPRYPALVQYWG
jgi:hypothetical protein